MKWLLPEEELNQILELSSLDDNIILAFADKFRTPPGVIIGQLQYKNVINYKDGNHLRAKVDLFP